MSGSSRRTSDRFLERDAAVYVDMGFRQFTLGLNGPTWTADAGAAWLAWRYAQNARSMAVAGGLGGVVRLAP